MCLHSHHSYSPVWWRRYRIQVVADGTLQVHCAKLWKPWWSLVGSADSVETARELVHKHARGLLDPSVCQYL